MSDLISGKEALIALVNGEEVLYIGKSYEDKPNSSWGYAKEVEVEDFLNDTWSFKLRSRTIYLNGIEVPAPFEPKEGERFYYFSDEYTTGYASSDGSGFYGDMSLGVWRTEDEIKQVVVALRSVFNVK